VKLLFSQRLFLVRLVDYDHALAQADLLRAVSEAGAGGGSFSAAVQARRQLSVAQSREFMHEVKEQQAFRVVAARGIRTDTASSPARGRSSSKSGRGDAAFVRKKQSGSGLAEGTGAGVEADKGRGKNSRVNGASRKKIKTVLGIEGMTCAVCVGVIEGAVKRLKGVEKVQVALIASKAEVTHYTGAAAQGETIEVGALTKAIESVGFGAHLLYSESADGSGGAVAKLKEVTLSVEGMTCTACVSLVESALLKVEGVVQAHVSLLVEKAEVTFDGGGVGLADNGEDVVPSLLVEAIEGVGFGATHLQTKMLGAGAVDESKFVVVLAAAAGGAAERVEEEARRILTQQDGIVNVAVKQQRASAGVTGDVTVRGGGTADSATRCCNSLFASPSAPAEQSITKYGSTNSEEAEVPSSLSGLQLLVSVRHFRKSAKGGAKDGSTAEGVGVREINDMLFDHFVGVADSANSFKGLAAEVRVQAGHVGGEGEESMEAKATRSSALALRRLLIAVCLTLPAFIISMSASAHPWLMSVSALDVTNLGLIQFVLSTPVVVYCGRPFYRECYDGLKHRHAGMGFLVTMGVWAAYGFGLFSMIQGIIINSKFNHCAADCTTRPSPAQETIVMQGSGNFLTGSMLLTFILLGKYLEAHAKGRTSRALTKLMDLKVKTAVLLEPRKPKPDAKPRPEGEVVEYMEREVDIELVQCGDLLKIVRGSSVPVDAEVMEVHGGAKLTVDESMLTGESMPVPKQEGDTLMGGTLVIEGFAHVRVTGVGAETALSQIVRLVEEAQLSKPKIQAVADKVASVFAPVVFILSVSTFAVWYGCAVAGVLGDVILPPNTDPFTFAFRWKHSHYFTNSLFFTITPPHSPPHHHTTSLSSTPSPTYSPPHHHPLTLLHTITHLLSSTPSPTYSPPHHHPLTLPSLCSM
jgi:copper ion binding protein